MKYTPILKGKEGELSALKETFLETKSQITPLIEFVKFTEKKSTEKTIDDFSKKLSEAWGTKFPIFIDTLEIEDIRTNNEEHYLKYLYTKLGENDIKVVPVVKTDSNLEAREIIKDAIKTLKNGLCLRITDNQASHLTKENIDFFLNKFGLYKSDVDIVIDIKYILAEQKDLLKIAMTQILNGFPYIEEWRSVILASTSFPIDLSSVKPNSVEKIKRGEWTLWKELAKTKDLVRKPIFGDYVISNPDIIEVDPKMMKMSASIRYTIDEEWLILKGRNVKEHGFEQFFTLSKGLISREEFCGENFCTGDKIIYDCATKMTSSGNATTWRKVATNHHIQKVVFQLSNFDDF